MARRQLESMLSEFKCSVNTRIDKLSAQVKIYGAVVTLSAVIIPAYSQITTAFAEPKIEAVVRRQLDPIVESVIVKALTRVKEEKPYCE